MSQNLSPSEVKLKCSESNTSYERTPVQENPMTIDPGIPRVVFSVRVMLIDTLVKKSMTRLENGRVKDHNYVFWRSNCRMHVVLSLIRCFTAAFGSLARRPELPDMGV